MTPTLAVVLHDVAPRTMPACERLLKAVRDVAPLPVTLLAVPRYHGRPTDGAFARWLLERRSAGDEIALHGYTHLDDGQPHGWIDHLARRHYTRGEGEFAALPQREAARRIAAGLQWLADLGIAPRGFVAPAWLMSEGTWSALENLPLRYTCTLRRLVLLPQRRSLVSQPVVYSTASAWRRSASLGWAALVASLQRGRPLLRLELHPDDAEHAAIRRSWQRILSQALADRQPLTLEGVARGWRLSTRSPA